LNSKFKRMSKCQRADGQNKQDAGTGSRGGKAGGARAGERAPRGRGGRGGGRGEGISSRADTRDARPVDFFPRAAGRPDSSSRGSREARGEGARGYFPFSIDRSSGGLSATPLQPATLNFITEDSRVNPRAASSMRRRSSMMPLDDTAEISCRIISADDNNCL